MKHKRTKLKNKKSKIFDKEREAKRLRALEGLRKIEKAQFKDFEGKTDISINHDKYLVEIYAGTSAS